MPLKECTDVPGREYHKSHSEHEGGDHDYDLVRHSDSGYHRIRREDDIHERNVGQYTPHPDGGAAGSSDCGFALQTLVNFLEYSSRSGIHRPRGELGRDSRSPDLNSK